MAELKFYGAGCFELKTKDATVVIDPYGDNYGKCISVKDKIVVLTQKSDCNLTSASFVVETPGEYEISKVSIKGVATALNVDNPEAGSAKATMYRLAVGDSTIGLIGNINPQLTDDQLESLGVVDYLIIPVGGFGLSIEPIDAAKLVAAIEPRIAVPSHFADANIKYPVEQNDVSVFAKELGLEAKLLPKLKLTHSDLPEKVELQVLENSSS